MTMWPSSSLRPAACPALLWPAHDGTGRLVQGGDRAYGRHPGAGGAGPSLLQAGHTVEAAARHRGRPALARVGRPRILAGVTRQARGADGAGARRRWRRWCACCSRARLGSRARPWPLPVSVVSEQLPNPESRVTLSSQLDPRGQPQARLDWRPTKEDRMGWAKGLAVLATTLAESGLGTLAMPTGGGAGAWLRTDAGRLPSYGHNAHGPAAGGRRGGRQLPGAWHRQSLHRRQLDLSDRRSRQPDPHYCCLGTAPRRSSRGPAFG